MAVNRWLAERYTPIDVMAVGALAGAILVSTIAIAQGIEVVPGTEAIGLLVTGGMFLVVFGAGVSYLNQKNRETFYGSSLAVNFDHEEGQIILDDALAIQIRAFPDGPIGESVTSFGFEFLGDGAQGWYVDDEVGDEEVYLELSLEEPA